MVKHKTSEENPLKFDDDLDFYFPHRNAKWTKLNQQKLKDLENHVPESMKKQLSFHDRVSMQYFPTPRVFAILSDLVYKNKKEIRKGLKEEFPDDKWQLFACARNKNGYYGAVFVNSDNTQAIIANRGTQLTDFGDLKADYKAIVKNEHHPQIDSAVTFTFFVKDLFRKINSKICISITGHSLGGFLGQVSTFVLKYFQKSNNIFEIIPKTADGYHAHCVAFESPGCEQMLRKLKTIDFRLDSCISYDHLDISNYVSAPNRINTRNLHIGTVYRIHPDLTKTTYLTYILDAHTMTKIVNVFKQNTNQIEKVTNWPLCQDLIKFDEYIQFLTVGNNSNNFDPTLYEFDKSIRYGTKEYDRNSITPISIFTQQEFFLLHTWKHLKMSNLKLEKLEKFVEENKLDDYQYLLTLVEIMTTELNCKELDKLISFIKLAPMFYPKVTQIIKEQAIAEPRVLKQLLISESEKYAQQLNSFIQKDITFRNIKGLDEFIGSSKVVLQVVVGDTSDTGLETCWIRNVLNQLDQSPQVNETGTEEASAKRVFLHWKQLWDMEKFVDLKSIFESNPPFADSVIVEYPFPIPGDENLRETMLNISKNSNIKKIIFVTSMGNNFGDFVKIDRTQVGLQFADLTLEWQSIFLGSELLDFEIEQFTLCQLLCIEEPTSDEKKNDLVSQKMLKQLLSGNFAPVKVGFGRLTNIDLEGCCEQVYEDVTADELLKLLLSDGDEQLKLYYFTGLSQQEFFQIQSLTEKEQQKVQNLIRNNNIMISAQERFQEICMKHPDRIIFWFHVSKQSIQCRIIYDSRLYINRSFSVKNRILMKNEIKKEMTRVTDKFIINQVSVKQNTTDGSFPSTVVMVSNEEEAAAEFDKQTNSNDSGDNPAVHWIECDDRERLLWKRSKGSLQFLKKFVVVENVAFVDEAEFINKLGRLTIITAEPGMGKTTSLASFCRKISSSWVIRITLRKCHKQIMKLPETLDMNAAVNFLQQNSSKLNDDRVRELFRLSLENDTAVRSVLLFDGFDEIAQSEKKKTIDLLKFFQEKTKSRICITTRKDSYHILENALSIFSIGFQEVTEEQQLRFLSRKWKMRLKLNGVRLRNKENKGLDRYTRQVLETTRNVLGKDVSNFMGIPLQLVMLAEVQRPKPEYLSCKTQQSLNTYLPHGKILDLYEAFIDKKCDIFFQKMEQNSAMSEMFGAIIKREIVKKQSLLALQMLSPESILSKKSIKEDEPFLETKHLDLNKIGFVQSDDKQQFQFVHRTFAEYFVALFVYKSMKKIKFFEISDPLEPYRLLMEILLQDKHKVIRLFLNDFFSRSEISKEKLKFHGKQVGKLLRKERQCFFGRGNETLLHVCAEEGSRNILHFILGVLQKWSEDEEVVSFIGSSDHTYYHGTALNVTVMHKKVDLLEEWWNFLEKCPRIVERVLLSTVSRCTEGSRTFTEMQSLLEFMSQKNGVVKSFCEKIPDKRKVLNAFFDAARANKKDKLKKFFKNADSDAERHYLMSAWDESYASALHVAAKLDNVSAFKFLIKQKVPFKFTESYINQWDVFKKTPLWSVENEDFVLKFLDIMFAEWEAPLHLAAEKGFEKVTSMLLEKGADVNAVDREGQAPLHLAAAKGHKEICSILLDNGAQINSCDTHNQTALHNAAIHGEEEICLLLLSRKADEKIVDINNKTASNWAFRNGYNNIVSLISKFRHNEM